MVCIYVSLCAQTFLDKIWDVIWGAGGVGCICPPHPSFEEREKYLIIRIFFHESGRE